MEIAQKGEYVLLIWVQGFDSFYIVGSLWLISYSQISPQEESRAINLIGYRGNPLILNLVIPNAT